MFNFGVTHESQIWQRGQDTLLVDPEGLDVPPYFPDNEIVRHDLAVNYSNLIRLDEQIGALIDQLKEDGLYDNTVIFFYSDHGGPFPRHKRSLYETGIAVPLIVRNPFEESLHQPTRIPLHAQSPYALNSAPLNFIDLAPTVLSLAGIAPPEYIQGIPFLGEFSEEIISRPVITTSDRFDAVYDRVRAVKQNGFKLIRNYYTDLPYALPVQYRLQMPMMHAMLDYQTSADEDPVMLWLSPTRPFEEFYDLQKDPYELTNLIDSSQYRDELNELRATLDEWIESSGDLGGIPEQDLIQRWAQEAR